MANTFDIKDCTCESAIVYLDRAEVARSVKASVKKGENEIIFNNLSDFIDEDSVRVDGKGPATISEVSFQSREMTPQEEEEKESATKELQNQLTELMEKEKTLIAQTNRLQKQRAVLDGFADSVMKPSATADKDCKERTLLNSEVLKGMNEFFDLFDNKGTRLDESIQQSQQETNKLRQEIRALEGKLNKSRFDDRHKKDRHLSVLLDAHEDAEVHLVVKYLVSNASWSPKYDVRVFSEEKKMKIMYNGVIRQGTGEDWNEVKISLSSAMPSVAGTVPKLGTQKIGFQSKAAYPVMMAKVGSARARMAHREDVMEFCADSMDMAPPAPPMAAMALPQAAVKESISSAVFEIVRAANIPSDNTEHKVTVAVIDLHPQFHYECVPIKSTFAYLKAKVTNSSAYAMLAGPTNIFLDNNFIAKGSMKAVSPGEEFECSCGVDPAIKISYKPMEKHRANTGWVSKGKITTYKQVIELKNSHQEPVLVRVTEHLPQSTESSIVVTLQEPSIKQERAEPHPPVRMTKEHNIEWNLELAPGVTKDLVLKYTIELPAKEELDYREEFPTEHM